MSCIRKQSPSSKSVTAISCNGIEEECLFFLNSRSHISSIFTVVYKPVYSLTNDQGNTIVELFFMGDGSEQFQFLKLKLYF